jgi:hypothetical protein
MSIVTRPRADEQRNPDRPARNTCRLTLAINHVAYDVKPIPIAGSVHTRLYLLRGSDGTRFTVASTLDGFSCHCDDAFRRDGAEPADCVHIRAMVACGLFDPKGGVR